MKRNNSDPIAKLTEETTKLLNEVAGQKSRLQTLADGAETQANLSAQSANESAGHKLSAQSEAERAKTERIEATNQAGLAKASADKASQITGLDTVEAAVQAALAESYQYAMTKAEFDAHREANKELYAGSGFVEWGKHHKHHNYPNINEGMWQTSDSNNKHNFLALGQRNNPTGISKTDFPVVNVDGVIINLSNVGIRPDFNRVQLPPAPNGTKTYDSATGEVIDHFTALSDKYPDADGNPTPAANQNEAVSRAFEGMIKNGDFRFGDDGNWAGTSSNGAVTVIDTDGLTYTQGTSHNSYVDSNNMTFEAGTYEMEAVIEVITPSTNGAAMAIGLGTGTPPGNVLTDTVGVFTAKSKHTFSSRIGTSVVLRGWSASQGTKVRIKSVSVRPVTEQVITTRKDLVFLESWHEDISEKQVLVPLGNVQYGSNSWNGITLSKLTYLGVGQGYCAFGEWDSETVGYGVRITDLTETQLQKFLQDPKNNTYFDAETGKLIQVRYRIRCIEGLGDDWAYTMPMMHTANTVKKPVFSLCYSEKHNTESGWVSSRGFGSNTEDFYTSHDEVYYGSNHGTYDKTNIGVFQANNTKLSYNKCFALPICLVQRLNQGAYHPTYNPFGTRNWCERHPDSGNVISGQNWYSTYANNKGYSTKSAFIIKKQGDVISENESCAFLLSGGIANNIQGRPSNDPYQFYDAIYAGQVEDLRLSAHKQDTNKLLEDSIRKAVSGEMRGKGKVPFTRFNPYVIGTGSHPNKSKKYVVQNNQLFIYSDWSLDIPDRNGLVIYDLTNARVIRFTGSVIVNTGSNIYGTCTPMPNCNGDGADVYLLHEDWLTPEFNDLPYTSIAGSPTNIAATFPNGTTGQWLTGTASPFALNVKCNGSSVNVLKTSDNGATWSTVSATLDTVKNEVTFSGYNAATDVCLIQYESLSNFTEPANNSAVVGQVGDVFATSFHGIRSGNRLASSVADIIGKNGGVMSDITVKCLGGYSMLGGVLTSHNSYAPQHPSVGGLGSANNSPAVKALSTLTEKDGLLYLQLHGNELEYKNPEFVVIDNPVTMYYTKGTVYSMRAGRHEGNLLFCTHSVTENIDNYSFANDGSLFSHKSDFKARFMVQWDGSGWGDDSTIPIINGVGTKEDLNSNIVKTFCHHSQIPLGIADHTTSAQSSMWLHSKDRLQHTKPSHWFDNLAEVPDPIKEFYFEEQVLLTTEVTYEPAIDELTGEEYQKPIYNHKYGIKVVKKPAYWENGGHIDAENIAAWTFHGDYVLWLQQCADVEFYNRTPQLDEEGNEVAFEPMPMPVEPVRENY